MKKYLLIFLSSIAVSSMVSAISHADSQRYHSATKFGVLYCPDPASVKCGDNGCEWAITSESYWFGLSHTSGDIKGQKFSFFGSRADDISPVCIYRANNGSEVDLKGLSYMSPYLEGSSAWNNGSCELDAAGANVRDCPLVLS